VEDKLLDEVKRKARIVAQSKEVSVRKVLSSDNERAARRIAEEFEAVERLKGCVIYDSQGQIGGARGGLNLGRRKKSPS
jgi:hypothetical protein